MKPEYNGPHFADHIFKYIFGSNFILIVPGAQLTSQY